MGLSIVLDLTGLGAAKQGQITNHWQNQRTLIIDLEENQRDAVPSKGPAGPTARGCAHTHTYTHLHTDTLTQTHTHTYTLTRLHRHTHAHNHQHYCPVSQGINRYLDEQTWESVHQGISRRKTYCLFTSTPCNRNTWRYSYICVAALKQHHGHKLSLVLTVLFHCVAVQYTGLVAELYWNWVFYATWPCNFLAQIGRASCRERV